MFSSCIRNVVYNVLFPNIFCKFKTCFVLSLSFWSSCIVWKIKKSSHNISYLRWFALEKNWPHLLTLKILNADSTRSFAESMVSLSRSTRRGTSLKSFQNVFHAGDLTLCVLLIYLQLGYTKFVSDSLIRSFACFCSQRVRQSIPRLEKIEAFMNTTVPRIMQWRGAWGLGFMHFLSLQLLWD